MLQSNIYGYTDMFEASVREGRRICAEELAKMFFALPPWVAALMKLRNALMKPLGLKGEKIARGVFADGIGQCGNGKQEGQTPEPPGGFQVGGKQWRKPKDFFFYQCVLQQWHGEILFCANQAVSYFYL